MDSDGPEAALAALRATYDLPEPLTCNRLSSGLNEAFTVTAGERRSVLKLYRAGWRTVEQVEEELRAVAYLDRAGFPVARPIARRDGAFVGNLPGTERPLVLFEFVVGDEPRLDVPGCRALGEALARLHIAAADLKDVAPRYVPAYLVEACGGDVGALLADRPGDRGFVEALLADASRTLTRLDPDLSRGFCHGDFRAANLRRDPETGALTIFDFELCGTGYLAYDLAYMVTSLHPGALAGLWQAPILDDHEALWAAFLAGYDSVRKIHDAERAAIPTLVRLRVIQVMSHIALEAPGARRGEPTWPPADESAMPGGGLFDRCLAFLKDFGNPSMSAPALVGRNAE